MNGLTARELARIGSGKDELEPLEPGVASSTGNLLEDNEQYKTIARSVSADQVLGRMSIPVVCIKNMEKVD